jgi:catechol 2,3-dioxygenase-like lactoylglutathione lyase family enzyme
MEFHQGRLVDHIHLRVADLAASKRFYTAALTALGFADAMADAPDHFAADELWVDHDAVERSFAAAIAAGGTDNGAPGERSYHPGYYAAFVLDPDGNNIEAVCHGLVRKSTESVVVTPLG